MNDTVITNVIIFTVDKNDHIIPNGSVVIRDERIIFVGPTASLHENQKAGRVINGKGKLALIPGLIDAHSHSSLLRGFSENKQLLDWLPVYQLEHQVLTEDDAYAAALLCYLEAVKGGTTCVTDMYRYMQHVLQTCIRFLLKVNASLTMAKLYA